MFYSVNSNKVEGENYFSQRKFCYFVGCTTKDTAVLKIARDDTWGENIEKMT